MENKLIKPRIISLDMFRGFAIFGMILVNYLGHFDVISETFKHPRYGMTFANAIAPFFVFAVGMGLSMGATALVARRIGEKDAHQAGISAVQSIWLGVFVALPISIIGQNARDNCAFGPIFGGESD